MGRRNVRAASTDSAAAWRGIGLARSVSAIRRNWPSTSASPIRIRPLATAIVPEMMSVLPRLKALIGIPNPIVTKPTAVGHEADSQQNESHRVSVPYQYAGGSHIGYQIVTAFRVIRKNLP